MNIKLKWVVGVMLVLAIISIPVYRIGDAPKTIEVIRIKNKCGTDHAKKCSVYAYAYQDSIGDWWWYYSFDAEPLKAFPSGGWVRGASPSRKDLETEGEVEDLESPDGDGAGPDINEPAGEPDRAD